MSEPSLADAITTNLMRAFIARDHETIALAMGFTWTPPATEEEWLALERAHAEGREEARKESAKRKKAEAEMWLSIYAPGVKYDPAIHTVDGPEEGW